MVIQDLRTLPLASYSVGLHSLGACTHTQELTWTPLRLELNPPVFPLLPLLLQDMHQDTTEHLALMILK